MEAADEELQTTRAKVANLTEQVDKLSQHNQELQTVLDQLKNRELKRADGPRLAAAG